MKSTKKLLGLALALVLALGATACKKADPAPEPDPEPAATTHYITDMMGYLVEIPNEVNTIAIATPVHTIFAMVSGSEVKLVSCPLTLNDFSKTVHPELVDVTNPFANKGANIEELLTINPDVVILADGSSYIEAVEKMGFPVVLIDHYDFDSLLECIKMIAEVSGEEEYAQALAFEQFFRDNEKMVADRLAGVTTKTRACYLWGTGSDLTSYGDDHVIGNLLKAAGAENVFGYVGSYKGISLEDVLAADPEVIFCARLKDYQEITTSEEWANVPAVQAGKVYVAPKGCNGYCAVAPEITLGLVWMSNCLYPDQMAGVDLEGLMKTFYKDFMDYEVTDEQIQKILSAQY